MVPGLGYVHCLSLVGISLCFKNTLSFSRWEIRTTRLLFFSLLVKFKRCQHGGLLLHFLLFPPNSSVRLPRARVQPNHCATRPTISFHSTYFTALLHPCCGPRTPLNISSHDSPVLATRFPPASLPVYFFHSPLLKCSYMEMLEIGPWPSSLRPTTLPAPLSSSSTPTSQIHPWSRPLL